MACRHCHPKSSDISERITVLELCQGTMLNGSFGIAA